MFFASPETVLAHEAQTGCPYFKMGAADRWLEIEAKQIVDAVKDGCSVQIQFAIINGPLELLSYDDTVISNKLAFLDVVFEDEVTLTETPVMVSDLTFKRVTFKKSVLVEDLDPISKLLLKFEGSTFERPFTAKSMTGVNLGFKEVTFNQACNFQGMHSFNANFERSRIKGVLSMDNVTDLNLDFVGGRAEDIAVFNEVQLSDANFTSSTINEMDWGDTVVSGSMFPPARIGVVLSGLDWESVEDTKPPEMDRQTFFVRWENLFSNTEQVSEARKIRESIRHSNLIRLIIVLIGGSFGVYWILTVPYFFVFPRQGNEGSIQYVRRLLSTSLDEMTPGIAIPGRNIGDLPVNFALQVIQTIVFFQRIAGWGVLVLASAILTSWFVT